MAGDVFISYRRDDAPAHAQCVRMALARELGDQAVFMDVASIAPGAAFPAELRAALDAAQAVVAVIGPRWTASPWVEVELGRALERGVHLVPVLVGGAAMPVRDALPEPLRALADRNAHTVRDESLPQDLGVLAESLRGFFGINPTPKATAAFPVPAAHKPQKLGVEELRTAMSMIPAWTVENGPLPGKPGQTRTELVRAFTFDTFAAAIDFMRKTSADIDKFDHHPRWENLWKTVTVWLSTWDIGHEISDRDINLARYLDKAYADLTAPRARRR